MYRNLLPKAIVNMRVATAFVLLFAIFIVLLSSSLVNAHVPTVNLNSVCACNPPEVPPCCQEKEETDEPPCCKIENKVSGCCFMRVIMPTCEADQFMPPEMPIVVCLEQFISSIFCESIFKPPRV